MPKPKQAPGLNLRLKAADRLQSVLKGASFSPLSASDIADPRDQLGKRSAVAEFQPA